jgi:hypothetical protein
MERRCRAVKCGARIGTTLEQSIALQVAPLAPTDLAV